MPDPHVVLLGAGPAGVGGAYWLRKHEKARVTVLEQKPVVGGNAGSFEIDGQRVDYGSHRLHPACDPGILSEIRSLLGDDLLDRPRHGRIRLRGKWIHFPLKPLDLLLRLDRAFAWGALRDMIVPAGRRAPGDDGGETFASVLRANLGPTICEHFYFPYARKIWGRDPAELSAIQARRRVSAGSFGKLLKKVLSQVPGLKPEGAGRFFYPRRGYGQISESLAGAADDLGARFMLGWRASRLVRPGDGGGRWTVVGEREGETRSWNADHVWSTIPISIVARIVDPPAPDRVLDAARGIEYRAMILVYVTVGVDRFTEYDAHYFPGPDVSITRLSEPKVYADADEPRGRSVLCAELPCSPGDDAWAMDDREVAGLVARDLEHAGIPLPGPPLAVTTRRLRHAYPIYREGYERHFDALDRWAEGLPRFLTYGRQGLFAHDNTHHALYMARSAADCMEDGAFDHRRWAEYRKEFETHVVED